MSLLYLGEGERLKSYSAATRGAKGLIKIEVETTDHWSLGYILRDLEAKMQAQAKADAQQRAAARRSKAKETARIGAEPLLLGLPAPEEFGS